jgi:3-oxoacyl-[acyl-carrier protein] reductase
MGDLSGQVAVITGASRGIGLATAKTMAAAGANVVLVSRGAGELEEAAQQIGGAHGQAWAAPADVSNWNEVEKLFNQVAQRYGRVDILVNNAGIPASQLPLVEMDEACWQRTIDIHLKGAFLCCRHALPSMLKAGYGRIINISSLVAMAGYMLAFPPGEVAGAEYAAAKAGLIGLTKALAYEVSPKGITVNAVCPGPIETKMQSRRDQKMHDYIASRTLVGKFGKPEDIAEAILFLARPDSGFVTGEILNVNGGGWMG